MFDQCVLKNGLTVIGERLPHYRSVALGVWIAAGSQYETREENGLSHFLEHMMFKGTPTRSAAKIAEVMDAVGGQINAFTGKECTCLYAKVLDRHVGLAMDVLSDLTLHSLLDPVEIQKERGVILEEIAMVEDDPEDLVQDVIMRAQFGDTPIAWPILGPAENVRRFSREDIAAYRARMYRPECSVLAVAGNYDWDALVALAETFFGSWQRGDGACPVCDAVCAPPAVIRREKDIEQLHLCLSWPGCPMGHEDVYPISLFNSILGGAMSSRLFQRIREERGLAYSVYSYPSFFTSTGMVAVYVGASRENAPQVLSLIRAELDTLCKDGVTRDEFEQTREQFKGSYVLGQESTNARMNALGRRKLLLGDTQTEDEALAKLDQVTYESVNRALRDVFSRPAAVAVVGKGANSLDFGPFAPPER